MSLLTIIFLFSSTGLSEIKPLADVDSLEVRTSAVTTSETTSEGNVLEYTYGMNTYSIGFNKNSISTNIPEENIDVSSGTIGLKIKLLSLPMRGGKEFPLYLIYRGSPLSFPEVRYRTLDGLWSQYGTGFNWENLTGNSFVVSADMGNCGLGWNVMPGELSLISEQTHPCCGGGCGYNLGPCCVGSRRAYASLNGNNYEMFEVAAIPDPVNLPCSYCGDGGTWFVKGRPDCKFYLEDCDVCYLNNYLLCELYTPEYTYLFYECTDFFPTPALWSSLRKTVLLTDMIDKNGNYVKVSWWDDPGQGNNGSTFLTTPPAQRIPDTIFTPTDTCYIYRKTIIPDANVGREPEEVYCAWNFYVIDSVVENINGEHFVVNFHYHQEWYSTIMEYWYGHQFVLLDSIEFLKDGQRLKPPYRFKYSEFSGLSGELTSFTSPDGAKYSYTYQTVADSAFEYDYDYNLLGYSKTKYRRIRYKKVDLPEPKSDIDYTYDYPDAANLSSGSVGPKCSNRRIYAPEFGALTFYPIYKRCNVSMGDEVWIGYTFVDSAWVSNHIGVEKRPEISPIDMFLQTNGHPYYGNIFPCEKEEFYGKPLRIVKAEGSVNKELTQFHYVLGDKIAPDVYGSSPLHPVLKYKFIQNSPNNDNLEEGEKVKVYHYKEYDEYDNVKRYEFLGEVDYKEVADISSQILTFGDPEDEFRYQEWENKNLPGYENDDYTDNWEVRKSYLHEHDDNYKDDELCLYHLEGTAKKFKKTGSSSWERVSQKIYEYDNTDLTDISNPILHDSPNWYKDYDVSFTTRGNLTKKTEWINEDETRSQQYWYDICGNLVKMRDYMGYDYEYDYGPAYVFPDIVTYPDGSIEDFDFDKEGNIVKVTDKNNVSRYFEYDCYGRLTSDKIGSDLLNEYQYNDFERWARARSYYSINWNDATDYYYDELGRLEENRRLSMSGKEVIKEYFYDRKGNLNKETVPRFDDAVTVDTVKKEFDVLNRVTEVEYPKSSIETGDEYVTYEYEGNIIDVIDEEENTTTLINDASGNLIEVEDALLNNTYYEYDVNGNLTEIKDAEEKHTYFEYDWLGNLVKREGPDRGIDTFAYDANGNIKYHANNAGDEIEFFYDELGRITKKEVNGQEEETYYYDNYDNIGGDSYDAPDGLEYPEGRLTGFQNPNVTEVYFYDEFGRLGEKLLIPAMGEENNFKYSYDLKGRLTKLEYEDGYKVVYDYDNFDNISSVEINDGETVNLSSTAAGLLSGVHFPGGVTDTLTYKPRNWMDQMKVHKDYSDLYWRDFEYNKRGELTGEWSAPSQGAKVAEYIYDALGRLKDEYKFEAYDPDPVIQHSFTYDAVGNRDVVDGITYQYLSRTNKLIFDGDYGYIYNDIGCIKGKASTIPSDVTNFTYDAEGKLVGVELPGGESGYKYYYKGYKRIREEKLTDIEHTQALEGISYSCKLRWENLQEGMLEMIFLDENNDEVGNMLLPHTINGSNIEGERFSGEITKEDFPSETVNSKLRARRLLGDHLWVDSMSIDAVWGDGGISGDVEKPSDYFYDNAGNLILVNSLGSGTAANVVQNPGFETGDLSGWTGDGWEVTDQYSYEGEYSLYICKRGEYSVYQEIPLSEISDTSITISCWVNIEWTFFGGEFQLKGVLKGDGNAQEYASESIEETDGWEEVSLTINDIPDWASNCEIRLMKNSGWAKMWVDNVVCELEMEQITATKYIYAGNRLLAKEKGGDLHFYHLDRIGSPIMITDESGNVVKEKKYEAFGNLVWASDATHEDNREFTGKEKDPTGFHYFGARYYYGDIGRFLAPDPHTVSPGNIDLSNPQELNPYVYCVNDPIKHVDPNGLVQTETSWYSSTGYMTKETVAGAKFAVFAQVFPGFKALETIGRWGLHRDATITGMDWASSALSAMCLVPGVHLKITALATAVGAGTEFSRIEEARQDEMKFKIFGKITGKSLDKFAPGDAYRIGEVGRMGGINAREKMKNHPDIQKMSDINEFYQQMDKVGWNFKELSGDQQERLGYINDAYGELNSTGW